MGQYGARDDVSHASERLRLGPFAASRRVASSSALAVLSLRRRAMEHETEERAVFGYIANFRSRPHRARTQLSSLFVELVPGFPASSRVTSHLDVYVC